MHSNSCKGENKIVELPEQYMHSSAKFYITGNQGIYPVISYTELEDIDLTKQPEGVTAKSLPITHIFEETCGKVDDILQIA
jgi:hypothetical protein